MNTNKRKLIDLLEIGTVLSTVDGERYTNGIIVRYDTTLDVLTDFGNVLTFLEPENVFKYFIISDRWLESKLIGYPLPSIEERIQEQITKLNQYLITKSDRELDRGN